MTRRDRFLTALKNEHPDRITWAPNFDHWLNVNSARGTLPLEFHDVSRNDIVRKVGATIWARGGVMKTSRPGVKLTEVHQNGLRRSRYETPVGAVETVHQTATDFTQAVFLKEHMIKTVDDIRVVKYIAEDTYYEPDYEPFVEMERDVGDDGISLTGIPCVPFIQFAKTDAGWVNGLYIWADYRDEVEELLEVYSRKAVEAAKIAAESPAPVVATGDNTDEVTFPPHLFRRYAIPYYQMIAPILHEGDKVFEAHWCGRVKRLLELVPETGLDVIEAIVPKPMSDLTIPEALAVLRGKAVVQGGVPSIYMCEQCIGREGLAEYVSSLLEEVGSGYGFVLGMADNVPPDADFERVRMISQIVDEFGRRP